MTRAIVAGLVGLLAASAAGARGPALSRYTYEERHMGTRFKLILYAADQKAADDAARATFGRIAKLDDIMSDYKSTSELMRLCAKAGGDPVPVSKDLFDVLERSQEVARLSGGAFDVTVGPVTRLWRSARRTRELPDKEELAKALKLVGYKNVRLDKKKRTVQLLEKGMRLDLGGIGKGYAADQALALLKQKGIPRALVAASGDIAVGDAPPGKEGWTVGIGPLEDPDAKPKRYLLLKNAAVSTSGDAEQFVEIGGKRYSHIVDPKTGIGLVGRMSVTVVAPNGTTADPLTKVPCVLGPKKGMKLIDDTPGAAALMIRKTEKGTETFESKRWAKLPHHDATKK
jgi:thiamine biosynthesis lipoprotein